MGKSSVFQAVALNDYVVVFDNVLSLERTLGVKDLSSFRAYKDGVYLVSIPDKGIHLL